MTGVHIRTRTLKSGAKSYTVRYRLGGRAYKLVHAGSFRTLKEARARRDLVAGEIANGRDPMIVIRALRDGPQRNPLTMGRAGAAWLSNEQAIKRLRAGTVDTYATVLPIALTGIEDVPVDEIDWRKLQQWVIDNQRLSASTLRSCRTIHRHILDQAGVDPNPARDTRIKLPREEREEPQPPTAEHVVAILERVPQRHVLPIAVLEQTGMRVNELGFLWGDVDEPRNRVRLRGRETKSGKARWVQLPVWLMGAVAATCPREDRVPERHVFPGVKVDTIRAAMRHACKTAGIPHYHPHDLRHRRISLWHNDGVPLRAISDRVGHARMALTIDVYSHVMPVDEIPDETWRRLLVMHP